ncbi:MAG: glycosyl hydrolase 53 family protein, partial [Prevotella sp.]|nr:glycosyl hydrolase 53 family protein [Prevotella sp.]
MKLKALILIIILACCTGMQAQKYVGGDLSLVPAYEAAGDKWLDADGNTINSHYQDGMITYVHDVAGWNAVRVRLIVEADKDNVPATCQDLDYVKKLGKRVKDAGMNLLLDIFYSDTWTDVSKQWIPDSWGYNRSTATETLAQKVKSYTTDVLNELTAYGAKPDFVQIGNEVSYGMLWDSASGQNKANAFYTSGSYTQYTSQIQRFATLLKAAAEGVRASNCAAAKIVLHCERTYTASHCKNFYTWVQQAGFTDYDIIGLSFYPLWHGTLTNLRNTLNTLQSAFPSKEIHIVETGYQNNTSFTFENGNHNTSAIWPYSPAGQAAFLKDLIAALTDYKNVTGLYYWQPEECGNGADASGNKRVMAEWDNRGFWEISWKSGSHQLNSATALMTLKTFISSSSGDDTQTDISSQFNNLDF